MQVENATKTLEIQEETPAYEIQTPEPPKVCYLKCPLCMGPFMEEMTTRCGHIFCKICIKVTLKARRICPTCGKKATPRGLIRVFLPSSDEGMTLIYNLVYY
ncbi:putative aminoacyltransferase, E1 ubiquitin-activating enzyme [Medicago truncatula]|nr:putative aminoacyltransferase, E1 ubiquitin-activating enzyme [Medicago truncatula]